MRLYVYESTYRSTYRYNSKDYRWKKSLGMIKRTCLIWFINMNMSGIKLNNGFYWTEILAVSIFIDRSIKTKIKTNEKYIQEIFPRLLKFSKTLDNLTVLIDQSWLVSTNDPKERKLFIFGATRSWLFQPTELLKRVNGIILPMPNRYDQTWW